MKEFIGRRWKIRCPKAVEIAETNPGDPYDFFRASGLVVCEICGHEYYDHPDHPEQPYLKITCDGSIVKL